MGEKRERTLPREDISFVLLRGGVVILDMKIDSDGLFSDEILQILAALS